MKDLNEYKQEILRRSQQRISHRKKLRRVITACCVPLAFCVVTVCALNALPQSVSKDTAPESNRFTEIFTPEDGSAMGIAPQVYIAQIAHGTSDSITLSHQAQVHQLLDMIEEFCEEKECAPEQDTEKYTSTTLPADFTAGSAQPNYATEDFSDRINLNYTLRFTDPSGKETVYTLTDYRLTNALTDHTVTLDAYQLSHLLEMLDGLFSQK